MMRGHVCCLGAVKNCDNYLVEHVACMHAALIWVTSRPWRLCSMQRAVHHACTSSRGPLAQRRGKVVEYSYMVMVPGITTVGRMLEGKWRWERGERQMKLLACMLAWNGRANFEPIETIERIESPKDCCTMHFINYIATLSVLSIVINTIQAQKASVPTVVWSAS